MFTHVSLLKSQIEALSKLQTSLLSVIECNEHVYEEMNQKLYEMFDRFDFKNNFWIYEGFLQMLSYFSVIKSTNLRIYDRIKPILNELIMNHEMKDTFKVSTIYGIFEKNLTLLLYLYEIHFLDFTMIELQAKKSFDSFFFFLPEIKSENMDLYEKLVIHYQHSHEEVLKYCQDNINPKFWDNRKFGHSPELLAKIIMDDDLDSFIDYISKTADFDLNSRVNDSISEYIRDIKNLYDDVDLTGISLIEYSMAFLNISG
ncbi:hypothetical protein TRFO_09667 [Tritrichomonas foetus]|uniref:DUF3447 domain-containing protein n=1 Tax=Tritrichomonas foetus TaxID=1144522 RepID=A0A1J4JHX1_9EUKA|nr:hypothetical protein TRFO_09667 [Tritrichomonas foetus]|eukprot:OHS97101.1 hypothetical protein TRFO_09667 [Tritrichomonas foetus]